MRQKIRQIEGSSAQNHELLTYVIDGSFFFEKFRQPFFDIFKGILDFVTFNNCHNFTAGLYSGSELICVFIFRNGKCN